MNTEEPKLGDKKHRGFCKYCGSEMFYVYRSHPAYHNDVSYSWDSDGHADAPGPKYVRLLGECVVNLRARIEHLESVIEKILGS